MQRYLKKIGAAGREAQARQRAAVREVKPLLLQVSDLPRRAESKVAWHLLDRRSAPSSKEGSSHDFTKSPHSTRSLIHTSPPQIRLTPPIA